VAWLQEDCEGLSGHGRGWRKGRGAQLDYHEAKSGNSTGRGVVAEEIVGSAVRRRLVAVSKGKEGVSCGVRSAGPGSAEVKRRLGGELESALVRMP
jgi:hypothetical protein